MDNISLNKSEIEALIECMDNELERMAEEEIEVMDPITKDHFTFLEGLRAKFQTHL